MLGAIIAVKDISKLREEQKELTESSEMYRSLFTSMRNSYALREIIYDDNGDPYDFKYLEVNPAFEKLSGKLREEVIGKTYTELFPKYESYWMDIYLEVAKTGISKNYDNWMDSINKYLRVHVFKLSKNLLGVIAIDLTERKKLEEELAREKELFKNLYSSMQNGYTLCEIIIGEEGLDFRYLEVNPAFEKLANIKREDLLNKRASEVFPKGKEMDDKGTEFLVRKFKEAAFNGKTERFDIYSSTVGRNLEVVIYGFGDGRFAVEYIDITDRKKLKQIAELERAKYYNLFDSMLDGFILLELVQNKDNEPIDFIVLEVNLAAERKTGFTKKEMIGRKVSEVLRDSDFLANETIEGLRGIYDGALGNSEKYEAKGYAEAFRKHIFFSAFIPQENQCAIIFRDFTEQKKLEDDIFKEKEQFRSLFENTLSGFAMKEIIFNCRGEPIDFICRLTNPAFLKIGGQIESEIIGVPASSYLEIDLDKGWPKSYLIHDYNEVVKTGEPIRKEYYSAYFGKYLDVSIAKMRDNIVAVSLNDISERKQAEEMLQWNLNILKQAQEIAKMGSWEYGNDDKNIWLSERARSIYGLDRDQKVTMDNFTEIIHEEDREDYENYISNLNFSKENTIDFTHKVVRENNEISHIHVRGIINRQSEEFTVLGVIQDVSELIETQQELSKREARFRTIINNTSDAITIYDKNLNIVYRSENIARLFGWTAEDFSGKGNFDLLHPEDKDSVANLLRDIIRKGPGARLEFEARIRHKNGKWKHIKNTAVNMLNDPYINGILINYYDITEIKQREKEILYLSTHEELTGLYNRSYYERNIDKFAKKKNLPLTVIMGDLNGLKLTNDMFGHKKGDQLLIEMGNILKQVCGEDAISIRFGGDEYCVFLYNTSQNEAEEIVNEIKAICEEHRQLSDNDLFSPSISLGIDTIIDDSKTLEEALRLAEDNMYKNKLFETKSVHSASSLIASIKAAMHEKSFETEEHSARLAIYSKKIGEQLNLTETELQELSLAAELHDIGKIGIDNSILTKPGKLNKEEWKLVKEHPAIGYRIAVASGELSGIAGYILSHHERWDGKGYPMGLSEKKIPLFSRIIAVVDAFDVMTNERPYRSKISKEEAAKELLRNAGTQFDPSIVQIFVDKVLEEIEISE